MPSIFLTGLSWWTSDQDILQFISSRATLKFEEFPNAKSKGNLEIIFETEKDLEEGIEALRKGLENIQISRTRTSARTTSARDSQPKRLTGDIRSTREESRDRRDSSRRDSSRDSRDRRDSTRDRRDERDDRNRDVDRSRDRKDYRDKSRDNSRDKRRNHRDERSERDRRDFRRDDRTRDRGYQREKETKISDDGLKRRDREGDEVTTDHQRM
jgi:hypothetical protein